MLAKMRNGEATKSRAVFLVLALVAALALPLAGVAQATHGGNAVLDVEPETATNQVGELHTLTATLLTVTAGGATQTSQAQTDTAVVFEIESGPGNEDGNADRTDPEHTCIILAGESSCEVDYTVDRAGFDTIRSSIIGHDEDEAEGRDDPEYDDTTDVVTKRWVGGPPQTLDVSPETGVNPTGDEHTLTATLSEPATNDTNVFFEWKSGPGDPDGGYSPESPDRVCIVPEGDTTCTIVYTSNDAGQDTVLSWIDGQPRDDDEPRDAPENDDSTDVVEKTWEGPPPPTPANLDVNPEDAVNTTGETHELTATLDEAATADTLVFFEVESGPGDTDGNTPESPDFACTVNAGETTCTAQYTNGTPGDDQIRAWVEGTTPDQSEGPDEDATNTNSTDVVQKTWEGPVVRECRGEAEGSDRANGGKVIIGTAGPDNLTGTAGDDLICGLGGDDTISGLNGADTIYGGGGDDTISGGRGADVIRGGGGQDTINGDRGRDTIFGGGDNDTLSGGPGNDTIRGGGGDDTINGDEGRDKIFGGSGNDTISGGTGGDEISGGGGDDTIRGDDGADRLEGDGGNDKLVGGNGGDRLNGHGGNDILRGGKGPDKLIGGNGNDRLSAGSGIDTARGGPGNDRIQGGDGADRLEGGTGKDIIRGQNGDDNIRGEEGRDRLYGGPKDDTIDGGDGRDLCRGGPGTNNVTTCEH